MVFFPSARSLLSTRPRPRSFRVWRRGLYEKYVSQTYSVDVVVRRFYQNARGPGQRLRFRLIPAVVGPRRDHVVANNEIGAKIVRSGLRVAQEIHNRECTRLSSSLISSVLNRPSNRLPRTTY